METIYEVQEDKIIVTEQVTREYDIAQLRNELTSIQQQKMNTITNIDARVAEIEDLLSKVEELPE